MNGYPNEDEGPDEVVWQVEKAISTCPFCQGVMQFRKALHIADGNTDAIIHAGPTNCGMVQFEDGSTDESIIAKWNTRSINAVPDLVAALERASTLIDESRSGHIAGSDHDGKWDARRAELVKDIDAVLAKVKT